MIDPPHLRHAARLRRPAFEPSPMLEPGLPLFRERGEPLAKVMLGETCVEQRALHGQPGVEPDLRPIDRGLDPAGDRARVRRHEPGDGHGRGFEFFIRKHARNQAGGKRFVRAQGAPGQQQVQRDMLAHDPCQALRTAGTGHGTQRDLGMAEARRSGGEHDVAHLHQLAPSARSQSPHRNDQGLAEPGRRRNAADEPGRAGLLGAHVQHLPDIRTGTEVLQRRGDEDRPHVLACVQGEERVVYLRAELQVQCVERVGAIQLQMADAIDAVNGN